MEITDKIDCCTRDTGILNVTVSTSQTGLDRTRTGSLQYGKSQNYKVQYSPPARGSYVTIKLIGNNVTLVLCQVVIRTIGKLHCSYPLAVRLQLMRHVRQEVAITGVLAGSVHD